MSSVVDSLWLSVFTVVTGLWLPYDDVADTVGLFSGFSFDGSPVVAHASLFFIGVCGGSAAGA